MKTRLALVMALALLLLSAVVLMACPSSVTCPAHDVDCYFTGKTQVIGGHLFGVYHCPAGNHDLLERCD